MFGSNRTQADDFGYRIVPGCLSIAECDDIAGALSTPEAVSRSRAGARHLMAQPIVSALANDRRLTELAKEWLGAVAIPFRATLFETSGSTNWLIPWHQDTALPLARRFETVGWGPWSEKAGATYAHAPAWALSRVIAMRVHLDASTADNGPLRVIPGSHLRGVLTDQTVMEFVSTNGHVECCVPRGGVIAMRPLIIHASSKARSENYRRVLHIQYADSLDLSDGVQLAVV
jgi:ectoine hydroxylase-related dioxygenase (phytanoyl-CoA dioxygenase family)